MGAEWRGAEVHCRSSAQVEARGKTALRGLAVRFVSTRQLLTHGPLDQGIKYNVAGRVAAKQRAVSILTAGFGCGVVSEVTDPALKLSMQQLAVGPVTDEPTPFTLLRKGKLQRGLLVEHKPVDIPDAAHLRAAMVVYARKKVWGVEANELMPHPPKVGVRASLCRLAACGCVSPVAMACTDDCDTP